MAPLLTKFTIAVALAIAEYSPPAAAFQPLAPTSRSHISVATRVRGVSPPLFAGFGGGGASKTKKKSTDKPLKPKQQWDRFLALKKPKVPVAVKESDEAEWIEVGYIKSEDAQYTAAAVARQKSLIAEHAKRLFPLKKGFGSRESVRWAYRDSNADSEEGDAEWIEVDKSALDGSLPGGFEKTIGFEGTPDPTTGFYCSYKDGKMEAK